LDRSGAGFEEEKMSDYLKEFRPTRRVLMGPGPCNVHPRVLQVMAEVIQGHLDPEVLGVLGQISQMLRIVMGTSNELTLAVSGTGSAAMEAAIVNIIEPGDRIVVAVNGYFGERLCEVARRAGAQVEPVRFEWGRAVEAEPVKVALDRLGHAKAVAMVNAETSTGVLSPVPEVARVAHEYEALLILDAVTSIGGMEVALDEWGADICYSGPQKCLGVPPGLAPITAGQRAVEVMKNRKSPVASFYLDLHLLQEYWQTPHRYHHTIPSTFAYALREGLRQVLEEGLKRRFDRHARNAAALRSGLQGMGLELFADPNHVLNPLTTVQVPVGVDEAWVRRTLLDRFDLEIGGGLGPVAGKIWRIGLMGDTCRPQNVFACLSALESLLTEQGVEIEPGSGVAAAQRVLTTRAGSSVGASSVSKRLGRHAMGPA
jgi:alanine-glyoxylate transaminase/serine-glyoxylate transaminase/serine-pyruvate transaminase